MQIGISEGTVFLHRTQEVAASSPASPTPRTYGPPVVSTIRNLAWPLIIFS